MMRVVAALSACCHNSGAEVIQPIDLHNAVVTEFLSGEMICLFPPSSSSTQL
jgi:hypothetical protein